MHALGIILLVLVALLLISLIVYIVLADKKGYWPFKKKGKKDPKNVMRNLDDSGMSAGMIVLIVCIVLVFLGIMIIGIYFAVKSSMMRYRIAGDAIKRGKSGVAVAALSPEIGEGVGLAAQGISDAIRGSSPY